MTSKYERQQTKINMALLSLLFISSLIGLASSGTKDQCRMIAGRRRGDPVLFEPMKVGLFSEKALFDNCRFLLFTKDSADRFLYYVALYIAAHKYFVKDPRFAGEKSMKPEFFKKFPSPELSDLDPRLKKACEANATACIKAVYNNGAANSGTIQQLQVSHRFWSLIVILILNRTCCFLNLFSAC